MSETKDGQEKQKTESDRNWERERAERAKPEINEKSWSKPGEFEVKIEDGRTTRIEGWLSLREGDRPKADTDLQADHKKEHGYGKDKDAGHIIAYSLGGPSAETNPDNAKQNLIPEDGRVNKSYIGSVEGYIRDELKAGKEVYCVADVKYKTDADTGDKKPDAVTYRYFGKDSDGKPKELLGNIGITTNVDVSPHEGAKKEEPRPSQTMGEALKGTDAKKNSDWLDPSPKGTNGWTQ